MTVSFNSLLIVSGSIQIYGILIDYGYKVDILYLCGNPDNYSVL
jgi:hypothetical protein